jgi:TPR repeat protein
MKKLIVLLMFILFNNIAIAEETDVLQDLTKSCQNKKLDKCVELAIYLRDDLESPSSAVDVAQKACDGGNMKGCNVLGKLYIDEYSGLGMNFTKAQELYTHACKGGYENACINLEDLKNKEQEYDKQGRLEKLMRACSLENNSACEALQRETNTH